MQERRRHTPADGHHARIGILPIEIMAVVLNATGTRGRVFLDPRWRFAARATCRTWCAIIESASEAQAEAMYRAWKVDGSQPQSRCQCDSTQPHTSHFRRYIAAGRLVTARSVLVVADHWPAQWCGDEKRGAPCQDLTACTLLALHETSCGDVDHGAVRSKIAVLVARDALAGRTFARPLRRDFWSSPYIAPDKNDCSNSPFVHDLVVFAAERGRLGLLRAIDHSFPGSNVCYGITLYSSWGDNPETMMFGLEVEARRDDTQAKVEAWQHAASFGATRVISYLLDACTDETDTTPAIMLARNDRIPRLEDYDTEEGLAAIRLVPDHAWQVAAAEAGHSGPLAACISRGVTIHARALLQAAARNGHSRLVCWIARQFTRADTHDASIAECKHAMVCIASGAAEYHREWHQCYRAPPCACYGNDKDTGLDENNRFAPREIHPPSADSLCGDPLGLGIHKRAMAAVCTVMRGVFDAAGGEHVIAELCRIVLPPAKFGGRIRTNTSAISLVVHALAMAQSRAERPQYFATGDIITLVEAAVGCGAIAALDRALGLLATREQSAFPPLGIDAWAVAAHCATLARDTYTVWSCNICGELKRSDQSDRAELAAAVLMRLVEVCRGARHSHGSPVAMTAATIWKAVCHIAPLTLCALPPCDLPCAPLATALPHWLAARGLLAPCSDLCPCAQRVATSPASPPNV